MIAEELVVFSHLRWEWVWQRPQHLVSRLARGRRTWFVEEPVRTGVREPRLGVAACGPVTRVWLEVPDGGDVLPHDAPQAATYAAELRRLLGAHPRRTAWLYTPLALGLADAVGHELLVYDVMDDLASFRDAPPGLRRRQRDLLDRADVVFTGGRSLHAAVSEDCPGRTHLFPSGVEPEHFAAAAGARGGRGAGRPVAGYVGVIDERIDLELVGDLAARLPDWDVEMVGPVAKIDPAAVPQGPNIRYTGMQPYEALPAIMGGWDVALMPFALNEATRSISPTKSLEYLAAGLPVVSTRVPDVVADLTGLVELCDDGASAAEGCLRALGGGGAARRRDVDALLRSRSWDGTARRMDAILCGAWEALVAGATSRPDGVPAGVAAQAVAR